MMEERVCVHASVHLDVKVHVCDRVNEVVLNVPPVNGKVWEYVCKCVSECE